MHAMYIIYPIYNGILQLIHLEPYVGQLYNAIKKYNKEVLNRVMCVSVCVCVCVCVCV